MPTLDLQVGAGADDGYSTNAPQFWDTLPTILIGSGGSDSSDAWYRFTGVSGLSGVTIDVSYITLRSDNSDSTFGTPLTRIRMERANAPAAPTSRANHTGKTRTTAGVNWDTAFTTKNIDYQSPSINTVMQEIADNHNPTVLQILHDDRASGGTYNYNQIESYESDTVLAPKLHIEYTAGGGAVPVFDHHYRMQRAA